MVTGGVSLGGDRSTNLQYRGTFTIDRALENSLSTGNVATLSQRQRVVQVRDVLRERQLSISRQDPVTVTGQNIQFSLTADCADNSGAICTYTPGLVSDRTSIDPSTLLPTQFYQTSNFGDVVRPETLAAIQSSGFQRGTEAQQVGVDLYLPSIAEQPGNSLTTSTSVARTENFNTVPALSYSEITQIVRSNANESSLGRTIRGPAVVFDSEQPVENVILAAISLLLPEVEPFVPNTSEMASPSVNRGLFYAANNTRLPPNSLTLYQAGVGHSATLEQNNGSLSDPPDASFNTLWLGLSPITERSYSSELAFRTTGDPRVILSAGGEGGRLNAPALLSLVNGQPFSASSLTNSYTQNYVTLLEQDAYRVNSFGQTDQIEYRPHLSLSGNITRSSDVFRYYAGTLAGQTTQAYGGLDYQGQSTGGWSYRAEAVGVINPNYDRYSNLSGAVSKQFDVGENQNVVLGTSLNWALDQDTNLGDIEQIGQGSDITVQARANVGDVSIGASQLIGAVLPNSQPSRTVFDTTLRLGNDFSISGFWSLFNQATSSPRYGLLANIGLHLGELNPNLVFSWQNTRYEYGEDLLRNVLSTNSNTLEVLFKLDW
ncbi:MAG: hypothetical protein WBG38_20305 [Nodosilinea sp.]